MPFSMLGWRIRHWIWSNWLCLRHRLNRPQHIGAPPKKRRNIEPTTFRAKHNDLIPLDIVVYDRLPREENKITVRFVRYVTLNLNKVVRMMQPGMPQIDADINVALDKTLTRNYRKQFRAPKLPEVFQGDDAPDLDKLTVQSPYAIILTRSQDGTLVWDLDFLGDFEHHPEMMNIGLRVIFAEDAENRSLSAVEIRSKEIGTVHPGDENWMVAKRLAVCAATTYTALTRHFNYVHLVCGSSWAIATRNELPIDHPIFRLLWPSNLNSLYTNHGVTEVQLYPDGDFVNMFSFTHKGLMDYYTTMHSCYRASLMDPRADWRFRRLEDTSFDCPTQKNMEEVFDIMHAHATRYVHAYYNSDEVLQADRDIERWLAAVEALIPNGLGDFLSVGLTRESLSRLIGAVIYEGNLTHDMVGTTLWDYQLWVDRNPVRMYRDGSRVPIDVLHRVIINNFALQLVRSPLLADYGEVALDDKGRRLFTQWYEECRQLQERYDREPADLWRIEPKNMEVSMNG